MAIYVDTDISGSGEQSLAPGDQVQFALVHLDTLGPGVRNGEGADHVLHAGFIAFGADTDLIGGVERTYWMRPIWFDWVDFEWHPEPTTEGGGVEFRVWANRVRWWLTPGTSGHLLVYGP